MEYKLLFEKFCQKEQRNIGHFLDEDVGSREAVVKRLEKFSACLLLMGIIFIQKKINSAIE